MNKKIEITNSLGQKINADIITIFKLNENNKEYITYTFNEKVNDNYKIYISRLRESDGNYFLDSIDDENEFEKVKNIVVKIRDKEGKEN